MQKIKKSLGFWFWSLVLVLGIFGFLRPGMTLYASPVITNEALEAHVATDGTVKLRRLLTYDIDEMNGIYHHLDREGYEVLDYEVGLIDPETGEDLTFEENYLGQAETYQVTVSPDFYDFKVFYPTEDEVLTFYVDYTLDGLVTNYLDTAVFNYKLVGEPESVMDVQAELVLPGLVEEAEDFRAWGHGAPQGEVELLSRDGHSLVQIRVPDNPVGQFVELHTIFPTSLTPHNPHQVDQEKKEAIIQAETDQVARDRQEYEDRRRLETIFSWVFPLLALLGAAYSWIYYRRLQTKLDPNPVHLPEHIYELPADLGPAVAARAFFHNNPTSDDFAATVVDLARRGYIDLSEHEEPRGRFRKDKTTFLVTPRSDHPGLEELKRYERAVYHYLTLAEGPTTLEALEKLFKTSSSKQKKAAGYWKSFVNGVEVLAEQVVEKATLQQVQALFMSALSLLLILVLRLGLWLWKPYLTFLGFYLALIFSLIWAGGLALWIDKHPIETHEEREQRQLWHGFKQMLADIGQMDMREIASLPLWEEYLVYAVAFGLADRVLEAMKVQFRQEEIQSLRMGPLYYRHPMIFVNQFPQAVQGTLTQAAPQVKYSPGSFSGSNTGGFGGGFSGGSSGGFGGGTSSGSF